MNRTGIFDDFLGSIRNLRRRPYYSASVAGITAVGLASCVAVMIYINGFYRPFPGADADHLFQMFSAEENNPYAGISYPDYRDYTAEVSDTFDGLAAAQPIFLGSVRHGALTDPIRGQGVTGNYFSVLGVRMHAGRSFAAADDHPAAEPAIILSHSFWKRSFSEDLRVIGATVYLNGNPLTVVGVASPEFQGSDSQVRPDIWVPMEPLFLLYGDVARVARNRNSLYMLVHGRLRGGIEPAQAEVRLQSIAGDLDRAYPFPRRPRRVHIAAATWVAPGSRLAEMPVARLMLAGAAVLLILAGANVAGILLSVFQNRSRELAVHAALGASPLRIARRLTGEVLVLAGLAACVALLLASFFSGRMGDFFAQTGVWVSTPPREMNLDWRIFSFAFALAILVGLGAGLLPSLRASRRNLMDALSASKGSLRGEFTARRGRLAPRFRDLLLSFQVALSIVLLVVAGLVLRTFQQVRGIDPGFETNQLVTSLVSISSKPLDQAGRKRFYRDLLEDLNQQTWVQAASMSDYAPIGYHRTASLLPEGSKEPVQLSYSTVYHGYFETMGINVLRGRGIEPSDREDSPGVAVINEALVRQYFGGGIPLGARIAWMSQDGKRERDFEVVGVVQSVRSRSILEEPDPMVYFSYPQHTYAPGNTMLVRTATGADAAIPLLERQLRSVDPDLVVHNVLTYAGVQRDMFHSQQMNAELFLVIAFLGLVLAAAGIFGVVSLTVSRRTWEIGVRMAMGAGSAHVARLVIGRALLSVALGGLMGVAGALAVTRYTRSLLYGIEPNDPASFIAGMVVLAVIAFIAAYLPVRRAVTVDPIVSLRAE